MNAGPIPQKESAMNHCRVCMLALLFAAVASTSESAPQGRQPTPFLFTEAELVAHVKSLATQYFADFGHPETHVLYGARFSTKQDWTSPSDVKTEKPFP